MRRRPIEDEGTFAGWAKVAELAEIKFEGTEDGGSPASVTLMMRSSLC